MRKNSVLSRWGGEEFIILLQFATKDEAKKGCRDLEKGNKRI